MIPKTQHEVEAYFKLQELEYAYKNRNKKHYERSPGGEHEVMIGYSEQCYQEKLKEYLEFVNPTNTCTCNNSKDLGLYCPIHRANI